MSEATTVEAEAAETAAAPEAREPRFKSVTLNGAEGETLTVLASRKARGNATTHVSVVAVGKDGKRRTMTGQREAHETFEQACARVRELAEEAIRKGWTRKSSSGFRARPDDFDSMPAPARAKPAKKR